jgi:hypothetical protein
MEKFKFKLLILVILIGLLNSCRTGCGCPMAKGKGEEIWTSTAVLVQKK